MGKQPKLNQPVSVAKHPKKDVQTYSKFKFIQLYIFIFFCNILHK